MVRIQRQKEELETKAFMVVSGEMGEAGAAGSGLAS
jgi:hypothetical protein